jgi:hypothetical protein
MSPPEFMPPLPDPFMRLYGQEERAQWAKQMHDYALAAIEAYKASLEPPYRLDGGDDESTK